MYVPLTVVWMVWCQVRSYTRYDIFSVDTDVKGNMLIRNYHYCVICCSMRTRQLYSTSPGSTSVVLKAAVLWRRDADSETGEQNRRPVITIRRPVSEVDIACL